MQIDSTQELWHQMENSFSPKLPPSNDRNSLFYLVSQLFKCLCGPGSPLHYGKLPCFTMLNCSGQGCGTHFGALV